MYNIQVGVVTRGVAVLRRVATVLGMAGRSPREAARVDEVLYVYADIDVCMYVCMCFIIIIIIIYDYLLFFILRCFFGVLPMGSVSCWRR